MVDREKVGSTFVAILKYGSAVVVACLAVYGANQGKADLALKNVEASYKEQTERVVELQHAVELLSIRYEDVEGNCEVITSGLKTNMMFFLMGRGSDKLQGGELKTQGKHIQKDNPRRPKIPLRKPKAYRDVQQRVGSF